jgi:aminopeptidase N
MRSCVMASLRIVPIAMLAAALAAAEPFASDLVDPADLAAVPAAAEFRIHATIAEDRLDGTAQLHWTNAGGEALPDLVFQAYANGPQFHGAAFTMASARIDGVAARVEPVADGLGVRVVPASPIAAGARVAIDLAWQVTLSPAGGLHGLLARRDGVAAWHAWYPELAPRRDGRWLVDPVAELGDPVRAEAHHLVAELTLADGGPLVCGGTVLGEVDLPGPTRTVTVAGAYLRNLTLVTGEGWTSAVRQVGGTTVRAWCRPGHEAVAQPVLGIAAESVRLLSETIAPYPWRELEVVDYPLGESVGGVESSGLILIGSSALEPFATPGVELPPDSLPAYMLEAVVSHEVAHQWWYGLVGNDAVAEPWLDESLTQWTTNWLIERQYGPAVRRAAWQTDLMSALMSPWAAGFTASDRSINDFATEAEVGADVYGRGAIAYAWLRHEVGDRAFFALLREWALAHRFQLVHAADWRALMAQRLGAPVSDRFFTRWITGTGLTYQEVVKAANDAARGLVSP